MGSNMDNSCPITVTMVSIAPLPRNKPSDKPPQVPPRTKKRLTPKDCDNPSSLESLLKDTEPPEIPSRAKDLKPPPVPPPSTKPSIARQVLQTKQLMETEFLRATNPQRQVLVAATKIGRDRKPESRQRQPAMLIRPDQESLLMLANLEHEVSENIVPAKLDNKSSPKKGPHFLVVPASKNVSPVLHHQSRGLFPSRPHQPPMQLSRLVFPRPPNGHHLLPQPNGLPLSYGKWLERSGAGDPEINTRILRRIFGSHVSSKSNKNTTGGGGGFKAILPQNLKAPVTPTVVNSKSKPVVSRSGSLSSQYSSCSDSGNESQPKSVLKKSKRNKGVEKPKKSVTFNAMTTVQVMEE